MLTDEEQIVVALRIPRGNRGDAVALSPTGRAVGFAGGDATLSVAAAGRGSPALTHRGELARAALRRSLRSCHERWPERLRRQDDGGGGVEASMFASLERRRMW